MKRSYFEPLADMIEFAVSDIITASIAANGISIANNTDGFDDGDTLSNLFGM